MCAAVTTGGGSVGHEGNQGRLLPAYLATSK